MSYFDSIMDRAFSVAKRHRAGRIEACHLLKVLFEIDRDTAVGRIGDQESVIEQAVLDSSSDEDRPDGVDPSLERVIEGSASEHDIWQRLEAIAGLLVTTTTRRTTPTSPVDTTETVATARSPQSKFDHDLIDEIAEALDIAAADVRAAVSTDLRHIADRIAPETSSALESELAEVMAAVGSDDPQPFELFHKLRPTAEGAAIARRVALAYIGVAYFCASVDEVVSDDEVDAIDVLRLELRSVLSEEALGRSSIDDVFDRHFGDLIGLEHVKRELRHRLDYFLVSQLRRDRGMPVSEQSLHMAFLGNPGTGKTHVARRFAAALRDLEVLSSGHLVEVDRSGLIGQYVGHTEKRVTDVVNSALGGVLFVDEAYALSDGSLNGGFGDEAIDVLVKRLEDDRANFLAIFAGYQNEMEEFLTRNPGLRSRIPGVLNFPDYDLDELTKVAEIMATESGYRFDDEAVDKFRQTVGSLRNQREFGNARTVRNVFEETVRRQFARLSPLGDLATDDEQRLLTAGDIPQPDEPRAQRAIGFQRVLSD